MNEQISGERAAQLARVIESRNEIQQRLEAWLQTLTYVATNSTDRN